MKARIYKYLTIPIFAVTILSCKEQSRNTFHTDSANKEDNIILNDSIQKQPSYTDLTIPVDEYQNWIISKVQKNFVRTKKIQEFTYTLKYIPVDWMICNELKNEAPSQAEIDSLRTCYEGMEYYELRLQVDHFDDEPAKYMLSSPQTYQERIMYMSFEMQEDLKAVVDNNRTIDCKLFNFERTYGLTPYATFLVGFSKEDIGKNTTERTIVFEDNLFHKGDIKFNWSSTLIENTPKLKAL